MFRRCSLLGATVYVAIALAAVPGCRPQVPARPMQTVTASHLHALLLNGGGQPASNYASHLRHLEEMRDVLDAVAIPESRVTVLASDGEDPGLDLATREPATADDFWRLAGTPAAASLRPPLTFISSRLPGITLRPATPAELTAWAERARAELRAGDTLFVFVTDHGTRNPDDTDNNRITLWGRGQAISVQELRALLDGFDPGVRVVTVMSQCFSGSFANLARPEPARGPRDVCGYFSTTADRPAYGCYPENRDRDDVGYAFHLARALRRTGDLGAAHRSALVADASPDVPLRTSDVFLADVVERGAKAAGTELVPFADRWIARAFTDRKRWEPEIRLLDAIGERYGIFSPRRLAEVQERLDVVPPLATELKTHRDNWERSRNGATAATWKRFVAAMPGWSERLAPPRTTNLTPDARAALADGLLADLRAYTARQPGLERRLSSLQGRGEEAAALNYRMETRAGVLLRMRALLLRIAGIEYLRHEGSAADRRHLAQLEACEDLRLPLASAAPPLESPREPFPSFEDDLAASKGVVPGWMGVQFRPTSERKRKSLGVGVGAATVQAVYPDSPAREAGLEVGDVILGPSGRRFTEPEELREWVMTSPLGDGIPLDVLRAGAPRQVVLTPRAYPRVWPKLPGPPKEGSPAPALGLTPYRGDAPTTLAGPKRTLLFFWATWCSICKLALPDLVRAEEQGITVVAITDEEPEQLDAFFASYSGPFPAIVALDETRRSFLDFGVSGTPAFILIDAAGRVERLKTGYRRDKGLEVLGPP